MKEFEQEIVVGKNRVTGFWWKCDCGQGGGLKKVREEAEQEMFKHGQEHEELIHFRITTPALMRRRLFSALGPMLVREVIDIEEEKV